jgi:CubicO group peptidase (beta-lactamase class C family)
MAHRLARWCLLSLVVVAAGAAAPLPAYTAPPAQAQVWPTDGWRTSAPEEQGMDSEQLAALFDVIAARRAEIHSVLVVRNGALVAEAYAPPYTAETEHRLYSCTKSVTSALVGIAVGEGYIEGVDQPALGFFPDRTFDNIDEVKQAMTLEDLLTMRSGLDWPDENMSLTYDLAVSRDWIGFVLNRPMAAAPGTEFVYNNGVSHVLSAIVQAATGSSTLAFAQEQLFEPLGIVDHYTWETDPEGIANGGWGLFMVPRDMAKFGYLYLNEGEWDGEQIVPAEWVAASTREHVASGHHGGYGYQWWIFPDDGFYAAIGLEGQYILVAPSLSLVAVFTSGLQGAESDLPRLLFEEYVIPAAESTTPLPENPGGVAQLEAQIGVFAEG